MVFPVVVCGCDSWTIKKAERWRIDAFELWCWRRLFRVAWTARRSNQSILKEINPEYSLQALMLKMKLQYFGHLMWKADSLEKTLGKIEGGRGRGWQMVWWYHQLNGHEFEQGPGIGDGQGSLVCYSPWGCKESDMAKRLNWTELTKETQRIEWLAQDLNISWVQNPSLTINQSFSWYLLSTYYYIQTRK